MRRDDLETGIEALRRALSAWPDRVLHGGEDANLEQTQALKAKAKDLRRADAAGEHGEFLDQAETRLNIHIGQLRSDEGKCFF